VSKNVRVAIIGAGNCAFSLVQGVESYRNADPADFVRGLMHVALGGYHVADIEFAAAFDIDTEKVGCDLSEGIFRGMNNTAQFADVPHLGVPIQRGMTHDGLGKYLKEVITKAPGSTVDLAGVLKDTGTGVVLNYAPVGSEAATKWYTEHIHAAGCGMVNCIPVFIAREPYWQRRFEQRGLPVIGEGIKSQVGATIVHRVLTRLFRERGGGLEHTYQLNVGGNTDFLNMLERERLESKKIYKTNAVISQLDYELDKDDVQIGPSDYLPWLKDRKFAFIRLEGRTFGDSPNSAGIVIDALRCCKLAMDRGIAGALEGPSAYFMKSPTQQVSDAVARVLTEEVIAGGPEAAGDGHRSAVATTTGQTGSTVSMQHMSKRGSGQ
jgi:myo-inositol-1-phosphate synthase